KVAVVVAFLLAAHRTRFVLVRIPEEGLVDDRLTRCPQLTLACELEVEGALDVAEGVHVLDLRLRAERLARPAGRDVRVDAQTSLLHVAITHLQVLERLEQADEEVTSLGGGADIRLRYDLDQRDAGAVEVYRRGARQTIVQGFSRILLQVDPADTHSGRVRFVHSGDLQIAIGGERLLELRDLVPLRKIWIEVVQIG